MSPTTDFEVAEMEQLPYRKIIGSLIYISVTARPDIAYAVNKCAQFMANPGKQHWLALLDILIYLRGSQDLEIKYTRPAAVSHRNILETYTDADHGNDRDSRRSTSGMVTFMNNGPISWSSKLQDNASGHGTAQSEYQALFPGATETIWLRMLLHELGCTQSRPTAIHCDGQAAIDFANNPVNQSRMKSIDIKYHAVRDFIEQQHIWIHKVASQDNKSDIFTKPLSTTLFRLNRDALLHHPLQLEPNGKRSRTY
jgi:hypothetical protein